MRKRHFKTQYRLSKTADVIEHEVLNRILKFFTVEMAWGLERFLIDFAFGKSRYRKRGPMRTRVILQPIIIRQYVPRFYKVMK